MSQRFDPRLQFNDPSRASAIMISDFERGRQKALQASGSGDRTSAQLLAALRHSTKNLAGTLLDKDDGSFMKSVEDGDYAQAMEQVRHYVNQVRWLTAAVGQIEETRRAGR